MLCADHNFDIAQVVRFYRSKVRVVLHSSGLSWKIKVGFITRLFPFLVARRPCHLLWTGGQWEKRLTWYCGGVSRLTQVIWDKLPVNNRYSSLVFGDNTKERVHLVAFFLCPSGSLVSWRSHLRAWRRLDWPAWCSTVYRRTRSPTCQSSCPITRRLVPAPWESFGSVSLTVTLTGQCSGRESVVNK